MFGLLLIGFFKIRVQMFVKFNADEECNFKEYIKAGYNDKLRLSNLIIIVAWRL